MRITITNNQGIITYTESIAPNGTGKKKSDTNFEDVLNENLNSSAEETNNSTEAAVTTPVAETPAETPSPTTPVETPRPAAETTQPAATRTSQHFDNYDSAYNALAGISNPHYQGDVTAETLLPQFSDAAPYLDYFNEAGKAYNIDVNLLLAVAKAESNFNPSIVSSSGAVGMMQLMPKTAASLGVSNSYDARSNILGGAKYIADQLSSHSDNFALAMAAYNAGSGNVKKYGGVPPFNSTRKYLTNIANYYFG